MQNCFGFVEGSVLQISHPKINQNIVYNGRKQVHGNQFQSLSLPNGIIGTLVHWLYWYIGTLDISCSYEDKRCHVTQVWAAPLHL